MSRASPGISFIVLSRILYERNIAFAIDRIFSQQPVHPVREFSRVYVAHATHTHTYTVERDLTNADLLDKWPLTSFSRPSERLLSFAVVAFVYICIPMQSGKGGWTLRISSERKCVLPTERNEGKINARGETRGAAGSAALGFAR